MDRSQEASTPRFVFSAGCLFVLLVTAVQVWRTRDESPLANWQPPSPIPRFETPQPPKYYAEVRAEIALAPLEVFEAPRPVSSLSPTESPSLPASERTGDGELLRIATSLPVASQRELPIDLPNITPRPSFDADMFAAIGNDFSIAFLIDAPQVEPHPLPQPQRPSFDLRRELLAVRPSHLMYPSTIALPEWNPQPSAETSAANPPSTAVDDSEQTIVAPIVTVRDSGKVANAPTHTLPGEMATASASAQEAAPAQEAVSAQEAVPAETRAPQSMVANQAVSTLRRPPPRSAFSPPIALLKSAETLSAPAAKAWAEELTTIVRALRRAPTIDSLQAIHPLGKLQELQERVPEVFQAITDANERSRMLVINYDLTRRLAVYDAVRKASHPQIAANLRRIQAGRDVQSMANIVSNVRARLGDGTAAKPWIEFLSLDEIESLAVAMGEEYAQERVEVAVKTLDRLDADELSTEQQGLIQSEPIEELRQELRLWSTVSADYEGMITDLERYESNPSVLTAEKLARTFSQLRWSLVPQQNSVASSLVSHYRNANVRVTMTERFMNRMLPVMKDVRTPVREQILGARVFGNSASWTKVAVGLRPDSERINLLLLASGTVSADTRAFKGPVVVFNQNRSEFFLRKPIIASQEGIYIGRSNTIAKASTNFLGMQTDYDNLPVIGSMVRRAAKKNLIEQRHLARRILERRVASSAEDNVDSSVGEQLAKIERQLEEKIVTPLRKMDLRPQALDMHTTKERIVFRGRLSGDHQLAAYTARPRALAGNLVSLQVHESSFNNVLQQYGLDGMEGNLRDLLARLATRVNGISDDVTEEVPEDVTIKLASHDALRIYLEEGHVRFTLRIAELSTLRREWKDFAVSANYMPTPRGFQIELGREGVVELSGRRLGLRDQIALRGIFGKVFSKNRNLNMVHPALASDQRLNDLAFSQIVLRDGWIGLSLDDEPARVARQRMIADPGVLRR